MLPVVLVTATRDLTDALVVERQLERVAGRGILIHGDARGGDAIADAWARRNGWTVLRFAAEWDRYGRAAGGIRNSLLVKIAVAHMRNGHPTVCLAFPGPNSIGTHDCARKAARAGIQVQRFDVPLAALKRR